MTTPMTPGGSIPVFKTDPIMVVVLGKLIGKEEELKGKSTLLLILGFFLPPVAAMIVQGHINELYAANPS